jgi:hypothetical protein
MRKSLTDLNCGLLIITEIPTDNKILILQQTKTCEKPTQSDNIKNIIKCVTILTTDRKVKLYLL